MNTLNNENSELNNYLTPEQTKLREEDNAYWDRVFESFRSENDDMASKMFDFDENFAFEFPFDESIDELIFHFNMDNWAEMNIDERKEIIAQTVECIRNKLGIEQPVNIVYFKDEPDYCGYFNEQYREIGINENILDNPMEVLDTLAHEIRHGYQRYRADICENETDQLYKYNFEHYISPQQDEDGHYINYFEYYDQFIEAEARAFANEFTERMG